MKRNAIRLSLLVLAASAALRADAFRVDAPFLERWAFSDDRASLLAELAPGSDERFFFTVLLAQQEGRVADARKALDGWTAEWRRRSGSRDGEPRSGDFRTMSRRQAVLEFEVSPPGSDGLALAKALDVDVPDPQPEAEEVPDRFPSVFEDGDPVARALGEWSRDGDGKTLRRDLHACFVPAALAAGLKPAPEDLGALLEETEFADAPGIVDLVAGEPAFHDDRAASFFGRRAVHGALPLSSLLRLRELVPEVALNRDWTRAVLKALAPGAGAPGTEADRNRAWLDRMEEFALGLPGEDAQDRWFLLACIRLRRLELSARWPSESALKAFLETPRPHQSYRPAVCPRTGTDGGDVWARFTGEIPVLCCGEKEESIVRKCLVRVLEAGADEAGLRGFFEPGFFERAAVEAALLAGRPVDDARVREALGDEAFRALRDRQELAWARGTEELVFAADAPVSLSLDVKNVPSLRVAVYDVDPFAAARALGGEPDAAIDVDGNVPTAERALDFSAVPAIRRHAETIGLPELAAPGVYLVEVSGGSLSCRALVRKGRLRVASRTGAAGHVFTALADDGAPLRDAELLLDGRLFRADPETGAIRVPFAEAKAGRRTKTAVVRAGRLAAPFAFAHEPERYTFGATFLLPPESLVAGSEATLVVHPTLVTGAGDQVSLSVVEHPVLALRTKGLDGTESLETTPLGALSDGDDVVRRFRVPARLRSVEATLSGTVRNVASGTDDAVSARFSLETGSLAETDRVETLLLVRDSAGARLELRGRTGEPVPHREVELEVDYEDCATRKATLQGDADGVVRLGALPGATSISATCLGARYYWFLASDQWETQAREQTVAEGEALELTLPGWRGHALPARDVTGAWLSLRETLGPGSRGDSFVSAVRPLAGDRVRIEGLPPGDYFLWSRLNPKSQFRIHVVDAQPKAREGAGLVASEERGFEDAAARRAPRVAGFEAKGGRVRVRLAGAGPDARLHVVARRTVPMHGDGAWMFETPGFLDARGWDWPAPAGVECLSGIRLGDEARYVRERRALPPRIGNLLDAPSVLVSPWSPEAAPTGDVGSFAAPGLMGVRSPGQRGRALGRMDSDAGRAGEGGTPSPVYDFFAEPAVVLPNLVPDANGAVELPLAALRGAHDLLLVCADGPRLSSRAVRLPSGALGSRDLSLRSELDPDEVWTRRKSAVAMAAGEEIPASADAATSWQAYATVGDLFRLFQAIEPDGDFAEFAFVAEWAALPRDRRLELYGAHACHELDILLAFADEGFFREIVAPRLREKRRRDFVDSWLLGEDLSPWLEPGVFETLTLHERALAVRASPGAKAPAPAAAAFAARLARQARDRDEARAPDDDLQARLFAGALGALGAPETAEAMPGLALAGGAVHFDAGSPGFAPAPAMAMAEVEDDFADWDAEGDGPVEEEDDADAGPVRDRRRRLLSREEIARLTNAIHEDAAARTKQAAFRRSTPETREWRESGWWHRPAAYPPRTEDWIAWNGFWSDVIASSSRTVLSPRVAEIAVADATPSFTDRMFALAVSGLPFEAPGVSLETRGDGTSVFKAASPALLFREVSERAAAGEAADPVPVVQRFFDPADRTAVRDGETWEKNLPDGGPFYAGRPYGVRTVLSNPTGRKRAVSALVQIPEGAMPLAGAAATRERTVRLEPYGSWTDETLFYFPAPAEKPLAVQPAGVVERGAPAGRAGAFSCRVEAGPPPPDRTSWAWIARNGTDDEVLAFLRGRNLLAGDADLSRLAWRAARDKAFFERAMAALDGRVSPEDRGELFVQAFRHGDRARIAEFFALAPAVERDLVGKLFGPWFRSALVHWDEEDAGAFEHREFRPLLHARAHPFGDRDPDNESLDEYWIELLARIAFKPAAEPDDRLLAAISLYAMDRPDDAAAQMRAAGPAAAPAGSLAGDWLRAYAAFCAGKPEEAEALAAAHAGWPLEPWKGRWSELASQLAQIRGGADAADGAAGGGGGAPALPRAGIDLSEPSPGVVRGTGGEGGVLRAWPVDVEMLFSARPFDSPGGGASATFVRPAWETPVPAAADGAAEWEVRLPDGLATRDLALEATGPDGASKASLLHAPSSLRVRTAVPRGEIVVLGPDGRPVPGAYVKVYAREGADGPISFHKDGYTDLRGVFDYASVSARPDVSGLEFSLLVLRDGLGSRIFRAPAP